MATKGNTCVSSRAKIEKQKCVELNNYTKIIIEMSQDRYIFAWFALNKKKEPNKDENDEENLLQISFLVSDQWPIEIINLHRKWKNEKMKNIVLF